MNSALDIWSFVVPSLVLLSLTGIIVGVLVGYMQGYEAGVGDERRSRLIQEQISVHGPARARTTKDTATHG